MCMLSKKTYIDFSLLVCPELQSGDLYNPFLSKSPQNDNLFELTIQSGREMMVGRRRDILGRLGDGDNFEQDYL